MTKAYSEKAVTARAKFFSGFGVETRRCMVGTDGTVRVRDDIAGHYTICHALGSRAAARIRRLAEEVR